MWVRRMMRWVGVAVLSLLAAGCSANPADGVTPSSSSAAGPVPIGTPTAQVTAAGVRRPQRPPASVCDSGMPAGPASPPAGAVRVEVGSRLSEMVAGGRPGTSYWLAPGVHRLGDGEYDQVIPQDGDRFVGAPGAVLDGRRLNRYAFGGQARGVTISHLTVRVSGRRETTTTRVWSTTTRRPAGRSMRARWSATPAPH